MEAPHCRWPSWRPICDMTNDVGDEGLRNGRAGIGERPTDAQIFESSRSSSAQSEDGPAGDAPGPLIDIGAQFQPHQRATSVLASVLLREADRLPHHIFRRRTPTSSRMRCLASLPPAAAAGQAVRLSRPSSSSRMNRLLAAQTWRSPNALWPWVKKRWAMSKWSSFLARVIAT